LRKESDRDQLVSQRDTLIESGRRKDDEHSTLLGIANTAANEAQNEASKHARALAVQANLLKQYSLYTTFL
jgi:hypothetical protein